MLSTKLIEVSEMVTSKLRNSSDLFVGVTAWNSEVLLPLCLDSLRKTAPDAEIHVFDNMSVDATPDITAKFGAKLTRGRLGQADALNRLVGLSKSPYTLLIHADVVFVADDWFSTVLQAISSSDALVSPEDIGCGPFTRTWGKDMPESSFLFFVTERIKQHRIRRRVRTFGIPHFRNEIDFYDEHITYGLPRRFMDAGLTWKPMQVHLSRRMEEPIYVPDFTPGYWTPELGHLRYGLGNFYSLGGRPTHYHNWYDRRLSETQSFERHATSEVDGGGVPLAFLKAALDNLIGDYYSGGLLVPVIEHSAPTANQEAAR